MKRNFKHWSLRYLIDRIKTYVYYRKNPDLPWLTGDVNEYLRTHLSSETVGVEFGAGRSTAWFAKNIKELICVESNSHWYQRVKVKLERAGITNVSLYYVETNDINEYFAPVEESVHAKFDFCLVDGEFRGEVAVKMIDKLKSGAILVVDNINWFLPSSSRSPSSVPPNLEPIDEIWATFSKATQNWEKYWTSNGVTDSAIFIKP